MRNFNPKHISLAVLFALLVIYSGYQARTLIIGPRVWIESPEDGEVLQSRIVSMEGRAKNISWISLNGRQIFTDEEGYWDEELIVSEGISIMSVKVRDRFGRESEKRVRIILN